MYCKWEIRILKKFHPLKAANICKWEIGIKQNYLSTGAVGKSDSDPCQSVGGVQEKYLNKSTLSLSLSRGLMSDPIDFVSIMTSQGLDRFPSADSLKFPMFCPVNVLLTEVRDEHCSGSGSGRIHVIPYSRTQTCSLSVLRTWIIN